jgi:predicted lipid-binding transport protein (Tim44 family)
MAARTQRPGVSTWSGWQATALRVSAVAALLAVAGGLAIPGHRGLFGALALLLVLATWLLPERRATEAVPVRAAAHPARGEG